MDNLYTTPVAEFVEVATEDIMVASNIGDDWGEE